MTMLKIIYADQCLAERRGVKALIVGPSGVGKTSLLRTLNATHTLFLDVEAGDLAVQDVAVRHRSRKRLADNSRFGVPDWWS